MPDLARCVKFTPHSRCYFSIRDHTIVREDGILFCISSIVIILCLKLFYVVQDGSKLFLQ